MNVEHGQVAFSRAGIEALENEFLGAGNIEQGQILRRRADENQVIVLGIIESEQGSALDADRAVEQSKKTVKLMDGEHLSHAGVMIKNKGAGVGCGIEVAHPSLGPSDKAAVAEDDPGLLRSGQEAIPENLKRNRNGRARASL